MSASGEGWSFEKKLSPVKIITWEHSQQKVDGHVYLHSGEKKFTHFTFERSKKITFIFLSLGLLFPSTSRTRKIIPGKKVSQE